MIIVSNLGFGYYAQREISKCDGDKFKESIVFPLAIESLLQAIE